MFEYKFITLSFVYVFSVYMYFLNSSNWFFFMPLGVLYLEPKDGCWSKQ